jgi:glycerol 2-dehydrogenase (NADP+)
LNPNGSDRMFPRLPDGTRDRTPERTIEQTWADMEKVFKSGKARAIGVSNWSIPNLERILASGSVVPATNQSKLYIQKPVLSVVNE